MDDMRKVGGGLMRPGILAALLLAAGLAGSKSLPAQQGGPAPPAQDARNTDIRNTDTHLPLPEFASLQAWEQRRAFLRNQILVSAGLSPLPEKTPLHAQVFGRIETKDYTIEKVLIETLPGFYLGGNLYRPRNGKAKHPAVLNPHGHWPYGRLENQPLYSGPSFGISLARQGYVAFAYDMLGYSDTVQTPHRFGSPEQRLWSFGPLGLQLWNSIRALDFVATLGDVDATRIGIAGASGGGTQTFLLAAVDDRIRFASPVNMVSAMMQGGDLCENAPGLRLNTSNVEIAALFAPRPMLLVSATGDWTRNVPTEEFPAIRRIYDLYGKGGQVEVVQIDEVHNFNRLSREAVYRFLAEQNPGLSDSRELKEHDIDVPMLPEMLALSNRTLPPGALDLDGLFRSWQARARAQTSGIQDAGFLRDRLRQVLAVETPQNVAASLDGQSIILSRPGKGDRVPGVFVPGAGPVAIVVDPDGSAAALETPLVSRLKRDGRAVLLVDVFETGAAKAPRSGDAAVGFKPEMTDKADEEARADAAAGGALFLTFNVPVDAARVQDIVTASVYASRGGAAVDVFARGDAALWAEFAAAVSPVRLSLHLENVPRLESNVDYVEHFNVPGVLRAGGEAVAEKLANGR
jgi:hypothetical protein